MFEYKHRVRYYETDKMGVAHHSSFVYWFENARIEFLRSRGIEYPILEKAGFNLAVAEINGRFLKPVFFDNLITVKVFLTKLRSGYARFDYKVENEKGELVVEGFTKHIIVNGNLEKSLLPESLSKKLFDALKKEK